MVSFSLTYFIKKISLLHFYYLYTNTLVIFITIFFLFSFFLLLFLKKDYLKFTYLTINILKNFIIIFLAIITILFILKFILKFWVISYVELYFFNLKINKYFLLNKNISTLPINIFSDTIVILCLISILVSWIYLSERNFLNESFNLLYFFIFIIFTVNMVYTNNLLEIFIFFEFIFLPSIYFVYLVGYSKKVDKAAKYLLIWTLFGSFLVTIGIVYLYNVACTLNVYNICWIKITITENYFLFLLFFVGFGIKIPLWPFHYWLTKVHVEAPTGFSIFLSGFLVKTAFYCLSFFFFLFKTKELTAIFIAIILWGIIDASLRMWVATDIKRLIAFATIQEMNLLLIILIITNNTYLQFINLFLLVHGVLSALLFFLVDQVQKHFVTRSLAVVSGLAYFSSALHILIWISILIFRGFPLFIKFCIEWEILSILIINYSWGGLVLFFIITIFGVLGFCRIWFIILYGQPNNIKLSIDILKIDFFSAYILVGCLIFLNLLLIFF